RPVVVPGGGDYYESVRRRLVTPPGEFFRIVAGGAQSRGVVPAGFAAVGEGIGVVDMLDRCFAPWRAADVIANDDHAPEQTGEFPPAGVHAHELAVLRPRVQPTEDRKSVV